MRWPGRRQSDMPEVEAVRISPTCAVPLMVGAPLAAEFSGGVCWLDVPGPETVNSSALDSFMLRMLHIAPSAAQSVVAGRSITETSASPDGVTA